jgi:hypothetical protein
MPYAPAVTATADEVRYGCQFAGCPWSFETPQELSDHYVAGHGARLGTREGPPPK